MSEREKPNWCWVTMNVVLPKAQVENLKSMFVNIADEKGLDKSGCFPSSYLNRIDMLEENDAGMALVQLSFNCAWCVDTSLVTAYPAKYKRPGLKDAIDKLGILRLSGYSQIRKANMTEDIAYDRSQGGKIYIKSRPFLRRDCTYLLPEDRPSEPTDQPKEGKQD